MARPLAIELLLFLTPFALYALFLWATRARVFDPQAWSVGTIMWLCLAAFALVIGSFIVLAQFSGEPPGSVYVPAEMKDGTVVPGSTR
jgi:hypothetical protein